MNRRDFLASAGGVAAALAAPGAEASAQTPPPAAPRGRYRTGLVAYSFQRQLAAGTMTYEDLVRIVVETGADGIDLTSYWLPAQNLDAYLLSLRKLAWKNRVEIYSVGTRVQLVAQGTPEGRTRQLDEVRRWVGVAQKLGASVIRVFSGARPQHLSMEQAIDFAAETFKAAADISGAQGITLALEDDGGMTEYAKETIAIITRANHPYAGMKLDIGNFRPPKVYDQIQMSVPYAVSTHFKTTVADDEGGGRSLFDWDRVLTMLVAGGYKGYLGLEFEAAGDPLVDVPIALRRLRDIADKYSR